MFLHGGRKPELPERIHTYTERTCKLHTERPQPGIEPGTLLLLADGADHRSPDKEKIIQNQVLLRSDGAEALMITLKCECGLRA